MAHAEVGAIARAAAVWWPAWRCDCLCGPPNRDHCLPRRSPYIQTLVGGTIAIVASLVVLFGVYVRISYDRKVEENKLKHEAFAFATALLRQAEDFQSKLSVIFMYAIRPLEMGHMSTV